jgi:hypothetical protein
VDIFTEVFEALVVVPIHEDTHPIVNIDDEDSLVERQPRKILDYV